MRPQIDSIVYDLNAWGGVNLRRTGLYLATAAIKLTAGSCSTIRGRNSISLARYLYLNSSARVRDKICAAMFALLAAGAKIFLLRGCEYNDYEMDPNCQFKCDCNGGLLGRCQLS